LQPWLAAAIASSCAAGCGTHGTITPQPREIASPAPAASAEGNLYASGGRVVLSWIEPKGTDGKKLCFSSFEKSAWCAAIAVAGGPALFANWADFPSVVELGDGSRVAHWMEKNPTAEHAYDVMVARSTDGTTWREGSRPHHDGTASEHGFVSLVPGDDASCTIVWLDGRAAAGKPEGEGEMRLMAAELTPNGLGDETLLDPRVCDCCQTTAVRTARGVLVAYRDRSPEEVRDISLVRRENGGWTEPYALSHDGWKIPGCPVNGPALDAAGLDVAAAWFTVANDTAAVRVALSKDGGATFSEPVRADDGKPLGHVDVVALPGGDALVVWVESGTGSEAQLRARRVRRGDGLDASFLVAITSANRASGVPHAVLSENRLYFAWTDEGDGGAKPSQVRLATLDLPRTWR
jgi:hypothetical protein